MRQAQLIMIYDREHLCCSGIVNVLTWQTVVKVLHGNIVLTVVTIKMCRTKKVCESENVFFLIICTAFVRNPEFLNYNKG